MAASEISVYENFEVVPEDLSPVSTARNSEEFRLKSVRISGLPTYNDEDPFGIFTDDESASASRDEEQKEEDSDNEDVFEFEDNFPDAHSLELEIPSNSSFTAMYDFVGTPLRSDQVLHLIVMYEVETKTFFLVDRYSRRILLSAVKRSDGLKSLLREANYSILMPGRDDFVEPGVIEIDSKNSNFEAPRRVSMNGLASPRLKRDKSYRVSGRDFTKQEPVRIAKLRGNSSRTRYSLFDDGVNPKRTSNANEDALRRELMAAKFEFSLTNNRRAMHCVLPASPDSFRPRSRNEMLLDLHKKGDKQVIYQSPFTKGKVILPNLREFKGFAKRQSIKNCMLFDESGRRTFMLGKSSKFQYNLELSGPHSVLSAFGLALANFDGPKYYGHLF